MNVSGSPFFKKTESPKWDFKTSRGDGPLPRLLPPSAFAKAMADKSSLVPEWWRTRCRAGLAPLRG